MPRRIYSDEDRAAVFLALNANEGNVARSSRDTGIPEQTVRDWKKLWEKEPPEFSEETLTVANTAFIDRATELRDKALEFVDRNLETAKVKDAMWIAAVLDDKIRLHQGLATSRTEQTIGLPSADEVRELFAGLVRGALQPVEELQVIEGEYVEQSDKELAAPRD